MGPADVQKQRRREEGVGPGVTPLIFKDLCFSDSNSMATVCSEIGEAGCEGSCSGAVHVILMWEGEVTAPKMKKRSTYLQDAHPVNIRRMHGGYDEGHQIFMMNIG